MDAGELYRIMGEAIASADVEDMAGMLKLQHVVVAALMEDKTSES